MTRNNDLSPSRISKKSNKSVLVKNKKGQLFTCITTSRNHAGKGSKNRSIKMKNKSNQNLSVISNDVSQKSAKKSIKKKTLKVEESKK